MLAVSGGSVLLSGQTVTAMPLAARFVQEDSTSWNTWHTCETLTLKLYKLWSASEFFGWLWLLVTFTRTWPKMHVLCRLDCLQPFFFPHSIPSFTSPSAVAAASEAGCKAGFSRVSMFCNSLHVFGPKMALLKHTLCKCLVYLVRHGETNLWGIRSQPNSNDDKQTWNFHFLEVGP